jgi:ABC-2 type transport system permease protein
MKAMVLKEFRQLRRDRRTVAMMILMPLLLLVIFGYAARFDVEEIRTVLVGPGAAVAQDQLPETFEVEEVRPGDGRAAAVDSLRRGDADAAVVTGSRPEILLDGSELFSAQAAVRALGQAARSGGELPVGEIEVNVLFNEGLETSAVMVPAIAGMIMVFIGTIITSLGVVRERQAGTLEQLAVMPLKPRDVFIGKIAPYFLIGLFDLVLIIGVGVWLFDVPFEGNVLTLALGALLFLFVALGLGILISSVSENQGQAIQLALMTLLPQVLLSGMIFPVRSMAAGVRWIAYGLPLTYFVQIARGVMLKASPIDSLWFPLLMLGILGAVIFGLAVLRFRGFLAPSPRRASSKPRPALGEAR